MKKTAFFMSLLAMVMICSCSGRHAFDDLDIAPDTTYIALTRFSGAPEQKAPTPLYMLEADGMMITELYVPGVSDSTLVIHVMGQNSYDDMTIFVTPDNILFMNTAPMTSSLPTAVMVASADDEFSSLCRGNMDWQTGEFTPTQRFPLHCETYSPKSRASARPKGDGMNSVRRVLYNYLDDLSNGVGVIHDNLQNSEEGQKVSEITAAWTKVAIPAAKMQLYDRDPDFKANYTYNSLTGTMEEFTIASLYEDDFGQMIAAYAQKFSKRALIWAGDKLDEFVGKKDETIDSSYETRGLQYVNTIGLNTTRVNKYIFTGSLVEASKCIPSVHVDAVDETSITLSGSFYFASEAASSNFVCSGVGFTCADQGGRSSYNSRLQGENSIAPYTISGLTPATTYIVTAFYKTMSGTYYSDGLRVTTKGILFELDKQSLTFGKSGGAVAVGMQVGEQTTIKVTSAPRWIDTRLDMTNSRLLVKASQATGNREPGEIVLTAENAYGQTTTRTITVSQSNSDWDGSTWDLTVDWTWKRVRTLPSKSTEQESGTSHIRLTIHSVEQNSFTMTGDAGLDSDATLFIDNKGRLHMVYEDGDYDEASSEYISGFGSEYYRVEYILSRKGASVSGSYDYNSIFVMAIGGSVTRYETTTTGRIKGTAVSDL